ncbi:hypothetical protein TWF481_012247 [Arthrobotrys musiformis]|uniref:Uncharacterized protein n=1 Tax=Arthrobotrys musiformis TaxID=47236 RepID=A0AAV9VWF8_9PEZI
MQNQEGYYSGLALRCQWKGEFDILVHGDPSVTLFPPYAMAVARAFRNGLVPQGPCNTAVSRRALEVAPASSHMTNLCFTHKGTGELLEEGKLRYASLMVVQRPRSGQSCVGNLECNTIVQMCRWKMFKAASSLGTPLLTEFQISDIGVQSKKPGLEGLLGKRIFNQEALVGHLYLVRKMQCLGKPLEKLGHTL